MLRNVCRPERRSRRKILNEVLSLNAQEFRKYATTASQTDILNEVLSLNAQEFGLRLPRAHDELSSMKS